MIQGLTNLARVVGRELREVNRHDGLNPHRESPVNLSAETSNRDGIWYLENEAEEYSAVINFQLVPTGIIHMNREVREHIVDFFQ